MPAPGGMPTTHSIPRFGSCGLVAAEAHRITGPYSGGESIVQLQQHLFYQSRPRPPSTTFQVGSARQIESWAYATTGQLWYRLQRPFRPGRRYDESERHGRIRRGSETRGGFSDEPRSGGEQSSCRFPYRSSRDWKASPRRPAGGVRPPSGKGRGPIVRE